jgi:hypothetical protein
MATANDFSGKCAEYIQAVEKHSIGTSFKQAAAGTAAGIATLAVLAGALTPIGSAMIIGVAAIAAVQQGMSAHSKIQYATSNAFKGDANRFMAKAVAKMSLTNIGTGFAGGFYAAAGTAMLLAGGVAALPAIAVGAGIAIGVATLGAKIGSGDMREAAKFKVPNVLSFLKRREAEPLVNVESGTKNRPSFS